MARSMASSSWPDFPTKGSPCRSSCSPGASPTTIHCAWTLPVPNTVWVRPSHNRHAVQPSTAARSCGQSMVSMPAGRWPDSARGGARSTGSAGVDITRGFSAGTAAGASGGAGATSVSDAGPGSWWVQSCQTWMPISRSMARWRSLHFIAGLRRSRCDLQAHHDGVFAPPLRSRIVAIAKPTGAKPELFVDGLCALVALAHFQPQ